MVHQTISNKTIGSKPNPFCPICKSTGTIKHENLADRLFGSEGNWNIKQCDNKKCRQLWLDPMPNSDEIWKAYQEYYTHDDSKTNILPFLRPLEEAYISSKYGYKNKSGILKLLLSYLIYLFPTERAEIDIRVFYLKAGYGKHLLDIGCGNGSLLQRLSDIGWEVQGIDFDQGAVAYCNSKGLNVKLGDLLIQKFKAESFDVITLNHVIEHIFNPEEILKECCRIIKPGGMLVIATPNNKSWGYKLFFKHHWYYLDPPRHVMIFNRKNLSTILKDAGFEILSDKTTIRNEFYIYAASIIIKQKGVFAMGKEKPKKMLYLIGKFFQLLIWILLFFNKDVGGEVLIKATKKT